MSKTILMIEDEANLAKLVQHHLGDRGHSVVLASNGEEGLKKLGALEPDLIVLDVMMPQMNGLEFFSHIRTSYGRTKYPVLVLTTRDELQETFTDADAAGFMSKPFLIEDLVAEMEKIFRAQAFPEILLLEPQQHADIDLVADALKEECYRVQRAADRMDLIKKIKEHQPFVVLLPFLSEDNISQIVQQIPQVFGSTAPKVIVFACSGHFVSEQDAADLTADKVIPSFGDSGSIVKLVREIELEQK